MIRLVTTAILLAALAPVPAVSVTVSGQVTDEDGFGIFNVDLDFFDRALGQIIFTPFDNTDAGGFYSVDVPVSDYDVFFDANDPTFINIEIRIEITGATTLDATLPWAQLIQGHVQNETTAPIPLVDLDFVESISGNPFESVNDNTDPFGDFAVLVPGETFDVYFTPPAGEPYAGLVLFEVVIAGTTDVGTITLPDGILVSADAVAPGGGSASIMDTDFHDSATGDEVFTPRDNTDGSGHLAVLVPSGTFDVTWKPSAGTGWAWHTEHDVTVGTTPVNLGIIQLETGFAVTGVVRDEGATPVPIADLDIVDTSTGRDLPTSDDNTDAAGAFSVLPPAGTIDLHVKPPSGAALAAAILRNVTVTAAIDLGLITLPTGFPVTGVVQDVFGTPIPGTDLDAFELGTGLFFPTVDDDAGAGGIYSLRLPGGSWILTATPPAGSGLLAGSAVVNHLAAPAVVNFVLSSSTVDSPSVGASAAGLHLSCAPNPFRGGARISWGRARADGLPATLTIVDSAGRLVREYALGGSAAGQVSWDGRDRSGRPVAAGVYFYRLETPSSTVSRKVVRVR